MAYHGYIAIEILQMTPSQRDLFIERVLSIGQGNNCPYPQLWMQYRTRLDGQAVIFEALFNEDDLTAARLKQWLGNIFSVDPSSIEHSSSQTQYGPMIVITHTVDRLRMLLFGGISSEWETSRQKVIQFIADNRQDWEEA